MKAVVEEMLCIVFTFGWMGLRYTQKKEKVNRG